MALRFPFIQPASGSPVPRGSLFHRGSVEQGVASDFAAATPDDWIKVKRGEQAPELYDQVYPQQRGYALILLRLIKPDEKRKKNRATLSAVGHRGFAHRHMRAYKIAASRCRIALDTILAS